MSERGQNARPELGRAAMAGGRSPSGTVTVRVSDAPTAPAAAGAPSSGTPAAT